MAATPDMGLRFSVTHIINKSFQTEAFYFAVVCGLSWKFIMLKCHIVSHISNAHRASEKHNMLSNFGIINASNSALIWKGPVWSTVANLTTSNTGKRQHFSHLSKTLSPIQRANTPFPVTYNLLLLMFICDYKTKSASSCIRNTTNQFRFKKQLSLNMSLSDGVSNKLVAQTTSFSKPRITSLYFSVFVYLIFCHLPSMTECFIFGYQSTQKPFFFFKDIYHIHFSL